MKAEQSSEPATSDFVLDMEAIRKRAREHLDQGAVTDGYKAARQTIIRLLNDSLATELVCVLRYKRHFFMSPNSGGIAGFAVTKELGVHAQEEQVHADKLAERIVQLGGEPDFNPETLTKRSHAEYGVGTDLQQMLREDLIAERIAIDSYGAVIRYIGDKDPTTRRLLERILEQEEEHADEIHDFLTRLSLNKQ